MTLIIGAIILFLLLQLVLVWMQRRCCSFNLRTLTSLALGIGFGLSLQCIAGSGSAAVKATTPVMALFGSGYIDLLKMLVIPLVLTSIIYSIMNLGQLSGKLLQRLSFLSIGMLLLLTALASGIGLTVGCLLHVGHGMSLPAGSFQPEHHYHGFIATLLGMLPSNPIKAMTEDNTIAIVILAVFIGIAMLIIDKKEHELIAPLKKWVAAAFSVSKSLARIIISLTPYGVLGLMAEQTATQGFASLLSVLNFIGAMYLAMLFVIMLHTLVLIVTGNNPLKYYKHAYEALLVAFTTRSSFGTLPVSEEVLKNKFKLPQISASFVPSMGATIGMNACAGIFPAMLVAMALHITGQPVTPSIFLLVMVTNMLASLGVSGIPGTAFVAAGVTLTTLGLPYSVVGLVQGVDPIIDMGRTATNVNGVLTTAVVTNQAMTGLAEEVSQVVDDVADAQPV